MFSYEERMKALRLYIESNYNADTVIRELGYPSSVALRNWYKEYQETGTLHEKSACKSRYYTQQQKENAVEYYATHDTTLTHACLALGYPTHSVLRRWISELQPDLLQTKYCQQWEKRVKWTRKQKLAVVEEVIANDLPISTVAAKYGVSEAAISLWKKQLAGKDVSSSMKRKEVPKSPKSQDISVEDLKSQIAELEAQISDLKMELDAIETVAKLRKKAEGINLTTLTNSEKADAIDALRSQYRLKQLLSLFQMSKSSYCYHAKRKTKPDKYCDLRIHIREIFESAYNSYGYRRIHAALQKMGIIVSEKVIRRIMKEEGLCVPYVRKKKKYSSYKGEISPEVENKLNRDFHADAPNQKWVTDISEFAIPAGKVYLSPIIDCYDGAPVAWTIGTSPNAELVNTMLDKAISTLNPNEHPIIHSDRGCHYRWPGWINRMDQAELTRSMSKKGYTPDNAACEGVFGRVKNEMFYFVSWAGYTIEEFIQVLDKYLHWYAEDRIKLSLGGLSPLEYRNKSMERKEGCLSG